MDIINESVSERLKAGNGTVGTTEAKISEINWPLRKHIVIRSATDNNSTIAVGPPGANGFVLAAGESTPPMHVDSTDRVRVIGGAAGQNFSWLGI